MRFATAGKSATAAAILVLSGCQPAENPGSSIAAGSEPLWRSGGGWRLSEEPILTIGEHDGPEAIGRLAGFARMESGGFLLGDGRIGLVDAANSEVRIYDSLGRRIATMGRSGAGPGEFRRLGGAGAFAGGDSIVAWEPGAADLRLSVFSAAGEFARTLSVPRPSAVEVFGLLDDGTLIVGAASPGMQELLRTPGGPPAGIHRLPRTYEQITVHGEELAPFGPFAGIERNISTDGRLGTVYFGRRTLAAVGRERFYTGDTAGFEIVAHDPASVAPPLRMSRPFEAVRVSREEVEELREVLRTMPTPPTPGVMPPDESPAHETHEAFRRLLVDAAENVWVLNHSASGDSLAAWTVFDAGGAWMGEVEIPSRLHPVAIGEGELLGLWQDPLGVAYLHLHRLLK